jgi:uncharacterized protein
MHRHIMIVPSLACPASCTYCFGPHHGDTQMNKSTLESVIRWQLSVPADDQLSFIFHGGEPLAVGADFYRMALPLLRDGLAPQNLRFSMQSNLWLLTAELTEIFKEHGLYLGTSLDGPEWITDAQRGAGYFRRTMAGIELAQAHGLDVACICTFTRQSLPQKEEILSFFIREGLNLSIHAALPALTSQLNPSPDTWSLTPAEHGALLSDMLDLYLDHADKIRIGTLDSLCRSVVYGQGSICTFDDCLGKYLAVGPDGAIYPCQRFAGKAEYVLANVNNQTTLHGMETTPLWQLFLNREKHVAEECGDCGYFTACKGGCPYNALAAGNGHFKSLRDPHCESYKKIFSSISQRAAEEVFSPENLFEVIEQPDFKRGLLRKGRLLSLMSEKSHPHTTAGHARMVLAAVALATTNSPKAAADGFSRLGLAARPIRTLTKLRAVHAQLSTPIQALNNCYLHITFACPSHCAHCYASAGESQHVFMPVERILETCRQAAAAGFRQVVITGGEPLIHPERHALLDGLALLHGDLRPAIIVLRTSLAFEMDDGLLAKVGQSTDEIAISLDGDRATHDERRGTGSYDCVVANLQRLLDLGCTAKLTLAAALPLEQASGYPGRDLRRLANELGITNVRFRPVLPIGRAAQGAQLPAPQTIWDYFDLDESSRGTFHLVNTCGIGQNLYIEPDGCVYPCYAWRQPAALLGSLDSQGGLTALLQTDAFNDLRCHTVDTNRKCKTCALRYLCGGACRAWNHSSINDDPSLDDAPKNCDHLYRRAAILWQKSLEQLNLSPAQWQEVGFSTINTLD